MRTKTLLLTAALSAAGLATSMAQVYSVNAVGYVNVTVPANGFAILAMPLNNPTNDINQTLALSDNDLGANVYRFNPSTQGYYETQTWLGAADGWLAAADSDRLIPPGEGFFFKNNSGLPLTITFVGEVVSGTPTVNTIPSNFSIRGARVPKSGRLGWQGLATSLEFPADLGDNVYVFNPATQLYKETYTFLGEADGWLHDVDPVEGPTIDPGNGFFVKKIGAARDWNINFTVN